MNIEGGVAGLHNVSIGSRNSEMSNLKIDSSMVKVMDCHDVAFRWFDIERDRAAWDRQVIQLGQNVFHTSPLLTAHRYGQSRLRGISIEHGGAVKAVLGGLLDEKNGSYSALSFPAAGEDWTHDLPLKLAWWLSAQSVKRAEFSSFSGGLENYLRLPEQSAESQRLEFVLDLQQDKAERRKRISSTMKTRLNRHARLGFVLTECKRKGIGILNTVTEERLQRQGKMPGLWTRINDFVSQWHFLRGLLGSKVGRLYELTDKDKRLLAAGLMLEHGDQTFYMMGGCTKSGYEESVAFTFLWQLSEHYAAQGFRRFNLGGVPAAAANPGADQHGLYRFKSSFGVGMTPRLSVSVDL